jgi:hypothetical protein
MQFCFCLTIVIVIVIDLVCVEMRSGASVPPTRNHLLFKVSQLLFRPATARWRRDDLLTWPGSRRTESANEVAQIIIKIKRTIR